MDEIKDLVARVIALRAIVKDIHYQALLEQKWDTHKQMDEIYNETNSWFDDIQEIIVVPIYNDFIKADDYLKKAVNYCFDINNIEESKKKLIEFLADFIELLVTINKETDLGTQNLMSNLAQSIQKFIGWLNLVNNKKEEVKNVRK